VVDPNDDVVFVSGIRMHQIGCVNSHWLIVILTIRLSVHDKDFAIVGAIPANADGITYIYGRQSSDIRSMEAGSIDAGNVEFVSQEVMIVPSRWVYTNHLIFMDAEYEFTPPMVEHFTPYHRYSFICKTGVSDVLIGTTSQISDLNGVVKLSHIKDKLVEMTNLNETIWGSSLGLASAYEGREMKSVVQMNDSIEAYVCKQNVTRFPYEIASLAQDLEGELSVTMPSKLELEHSDVGPLIRKFLVGHDDANVDRIKALQLIKDMTLGVNAVGYLTESMHGARDTEP
jgi:4-hydroxybutyryl-CoA dehydratase/vinylacetyl-CoA-Delta-isomerase